MHNKQYNIVIQNKTRKQAEIQQLKNILQQKQTKHKQKQKARIRDGNEKQRFTFYKPKTL